MPSCQLPAVGCSVEKGLPTASGGKCERLAGGVGATVGSAVVHGEGGALARRVAHDVCARAGSTSEDAIRRELARVGANLANEQKNKERRHRGPRSQDCARRPHPGDGARASMSSCSLLVT